MLGTGLSLVDEGGTAVSLIYPIRKGKFTEFVQGHSWQ